MNHSSKTIIPTNMGYPYLTFSNRNSSEKLIVSANYDELQKLYSSGIEFSQKQPEKAWPILSGVVDKILETGAINYYELMLESIRGLARISLNYPDEFEKKLHILFQKYYEAISQLETYGDYLFRFYKHATLLVITKFLPCTTRDQEMKHSLDALDCLGEERPEFNLYNAKAWCLGHFFINGEFIPGLKDFLVHNDRFMERFTNTITHIVKDLDVFIEKFLSCKLEQQGTDKALPNIIIGNRPLVSLRDKDLESTTIKDVLRCLMSVHEFFESSILLKELKENFERKYIKGPFRPFLYAALRLGIDNTLASATVEDYSPLSLAKKLIMLHKDSFHSLMRLAKDDPYYHYNKAFFDEYVEYSNRIMNEPLFKRPAKSFDFGSTSSGVPYPPVVTMAFCNELDKARETVEDYRNFGSVDLFSKGDVWSGLVNK